MKKIKLNNFYKYEITFIEYKEIKSCISKYDFMLERIKEKKEIIINATSKRQAYERLIAWLASNTGKNVQHTYINFEYKLSKNDATNIILTYTELTPTQRINKNPRGNSSYNETFNEVQS